MSDHQCLFRNELLLQRKSHFPTNLIIASTSLIGFEAHLTKVELHTKTCPLRKILVSEIVCMHF